ncbi:type II toxin-antitoxin system VapB family antitoxin [Calidithermus timidus]|jgi:antitoxin VapB|uniref:type II toxin-antitoxin system VapB family antitoxin n=1 Tax=Calidithermus timidus TaxID=307124 RepID=UPI00037CFC3F|nr:type II toxin-antitoxin system VapB family antitoxin [Calidithermus timidus]
MALTLKNPEVERLAEEVARLRGESKTEAIRKARLLYPHRPRKESVLEFLEREVWPKLPPGSLGKAPTKAEQEEILGFGPEGF